MNGVGNVGRKDDGSILYNYALDPSNQGTTLGAAAAIAELLRLNALLCFAIVCEPCFDCCERMIKKLPSDEDKVGSSGVGPATLKIGDKNN